VVRMRGPYMKHVPESIDLYICSTRVFIVAEG
jgi:hypothetical protein